MPEVQALERVMAERVAGKAGSLLVRVGFDETSVASYACVEGESVSDEWSSLQKLKPVFDELAAAPPGPACLALRRFDFNRRAALEARIKRTETLCRAQVQTSGATLGDWDASTNRLAQREYHDCMIAREEWLVLDLRGRGKRLLFAPPEVAASPELSPKRTREKCAEVQDGLQSQVDCIIEEGWELLP